MKFDIILLQGTPPGAVSDFFKNSINKTDAIQTTTLHGP
jgi:hypothetical protein